MKYIIVDLDDTLLRSDKSVSEYTIKIFNEVRKLGFIMVFNTARSYKSCSPYMDLLKPDYAILNGGVEIADINKRIIYRNEVDKDMTNKILNMFKKSSDVVSFSIQGDDLYSNDDEFIKRNKLAIYNSFTKDVEYGAFKVMASSTTPDKWRRLAGELHLEFETYWHGTWFRFTRATKYDGNIVLFKMLKDDNPEAYVFGDDTGDLKMLMEASHPVCLSNSHPSVLKEIKAVTKYDNDHDGVAHYLEDLYLRRA